MVRIISIHALREEGDPRQRHQPRAVHISIHALREEGDTLHWDKDKRRYIISIHALREEGDVTTINYPKIIRKFLSTPSARRATRKYHSLGVFHRQFLSTPSARRATGFASDALAWQRISIHALREEGDQ